MDWHALIEDDVERLVEWTVGCVLGDTRRDDRLPAPKAGARAKAKRLLEQDVRDDPEEWLSLAIDDGRCPSCEGTGTVEVATGEGYYDTAQMQWYPDWDTKACPVCVPEPFDKEE
ncbi:hypothetical protein KDL45_06875 [bacterium]|nr:hypothetical protein [bacterium]MCB9477822.1 hypothetical protein [Deltaproteobacteria bacterium]